MANQKTATSRKPVRARRTTRATMPEGNTAKPMSNRARERVRRERAAEHKRQHLHRMAAQDRADQPAGAAGGQIGHLTGRIALQLAQDVASEVDLALHEWAKRVAAEAPPIDDRDRVHRWAAGIDQVMSTVAKVSREVAGMLEQLGAVYGEMIPFEERERLERAAKGGDA